MVEPRECLDAIKPYVPGKPIEELKRELGLDDVLKLASNENAFGPSPRAKQVIKESLDELALYPDGNCTMLKRELAAEYGMEEANLVVGNGSDGLLKLLGEAFLEPGDATVFAHPSFVEYKFVSQLMDAELEVVPLDGDMVHDLDAMAERVKSSGAKMVFVCNPNNPTGTYVKKAELDAFMDKMPDKVLVVLDEAYFEYVTDSEYPDGLDYVREGRNVIVLRTFSKIYGLASLRIGYGIASTEIIGYIHKAREPFNVNRLAEKAALASLRDENHVEEACALNAAGREMLYEEFSRMGLEYVESQANFVLVKMPVAVDEVYQQLLQRGVIVRPGDNMGCEGYIRVTVGRPAQNRRFIAALEEVLKEAGS